MTTALGVEPMPWPFIRAPVEVVEAHDLRALARHMKPRAQEDPESTRGRNTSTGAASKQDWKNRKLETVRREGMCDEGGRQLKI